MATAYSQVSGMSPWQHDPLLRILRDIKGERLLCGLGCVEQPLACGLGVVEGGLLGLFDIAYGQIAGAGGMDEPW